MQTNDKKTADSPHQAGGGSAVSGMATVKTPLGGLKRPAILLRAPTLLGLFEGFRRRWFLCLALGLLTGAILATALWFILPPPSFTARTLLQVASTQPHIINVTPESQVVFADYQRTQMAMVKNRRVLIAALLTQSQRYIRSPATA